MPVYLYSHPVSGHIVEVVQKMNDIHKFIDPDGIEYCRVFLSPTHSIDSRVVDPFSKSEWMRRTNKKMTVGDMMDESSQLSEKRAQKAGVDPIKQKLFNKYKASTGKNHPEDKLKKVETDHFVLEL